jgi:hypothetical protein
MMLRYFESNISSTGTRAAPQNTDTAHAPTSAVKSTAKIKVSFLARMS